MCSTSCLMGAPPNNGYMHSIHSTNTTLTASTCEHHVPIMTWVQGYWRETRKLTQFLLYAWPPSNSDYTEPHLTENSRPRCYAKSPTACDAFRSIHSYCRGVTQVALACMLCTSSLAGFQPGSTEYSRWFLQSHRSLLLKNLINFVLKFCHRFTAGWFFERHNTIAFRNPQALSSTLTAPKSLQPRVSKLHRSLRLSV